MKKKLIVWGGTGNFKVLCDILENDYEILGYFDRNTDIQKTYRGIPYLGNREAFFEWINRGLYDSRLHFISSIGPGYGRDRTAIHQELKKHGLMPIVAVHRTAFVAASSRVGEGSQVYAQSAVCVETRIGECCIINTAASVDHECEIEEGVTVGPGARIAGLVSVGRYADIYTGAVILPRVTIGESAVVGAGAVVRKNVEPNTVVAGNPARLLKMRQS